MVHFDRTEPYSTSSGEKPCTCISGSSSLIASQRRMYRSLPFVEAIRLNANLRRAVFLRFFGTADNLVHRQEVTFLLAKIAAEGAKSTSLDADVGEVDVPVDYISNQVADRATAQFIGDHHRRCELWAGGSEQSRRIRFADIAA